MKGYYTPNGYMGLINGKYMLFATESDYKEHYNCQKLNEEVKEND